MIDTVIALRAELRTLVRTGTSNEDEQRQIHQRLREIIGGYAIQVDEASARLVPPPR